MRNKTKKNKNKAYNKTKNKNTLFVAIGFLLLFISNILIAVVADYFLPKI